MTGLTMGMWCCKSCQYWEASKGECRRNAPQIMTKYVADEEVEGFGSAGRVEMFPSWPVTSRIDWCGEWLDCGVAR